MELSALEEESLAIVSIYGPSSFYALSSSSASSSSATKASAHQQAASPPHLPVYALKVSLEEPDFDYDPTTEFNNNNNNNNNNHNHNPLTTKNARKELEFRIYFPEGYPEHNRSAPVHEIVSIYYGTLRLDSTMLQEIDRGLEECFVAGEVVVFSWIEWLRSYLEQLETRLLDQAQEGGDGHGSKGIDHEKDDKEDDDDDEDDDEEEEDEEEDKVEEEGNGKVLSDYFQNEGQNHPDPATKHTMGLASSIGSLSLLPSSSSSPSSPSSTTHSPKLHGIPPAVFKIQTGAPIVDRKSVFVAHLAPITQASQVPWMIQQLKLENKKVIKATHNIMAYRVENENGTVAQDNDDDGETAAGSRLLHLMSILDVRNVVVVVSRWYGGIPLSADRFKHINNAARILLDECGYIKSTNMAGSNDTSASGHKKKGGGKGKKSRK
ncbi:hypothetical protein BGZ94_002097 [Podila epigama]|nr:hypothetical protein BGZ94_002097 [Podila epigama]